MIIDDYLNINVNIEAALSLIKDKIVNKIPFAFTRYGDGEIRILNNRGNIEFKHRIAKRYSYANENWSAAYKDARNILVDTLNHSDLIGLFDNNGILKGKMKVNKHDWSLKKTHLKSLGIHNVDNFMICDHQLPRGKSLGNIYQFKKILNGNSLCIISPHTDKLQKNIGTILEADVSYMKWPMPLNIKNRIHLFKELDNIKSDVVIFGVSQGGKDIGTYLKTHGKVCLDFGATLDGWAGIISRKWFNSDGVQHHCVIK